MKQSRHTLEQIFQIQVDNLSLTLQPFTIVKYQYVARYFVAYLRNTSPDLCPRKTIIASKTNCAAKTTYIPMPSC